ncbi:MAG: hypothetical protein IH939_08215 [Acidobacteria bacterium]|nr:hypothetical protein [Acidobacteriota bacterium]
MMVAGGGCRDYSAQPQLRLITEFVERGGGLLMLGGRRSFGDGGWAETEIADLLPVEIPVRASGDVPRAAVEVRLAPTPLGLTHPVTQIGADAGETQCEPHRRSEAHGLDPPRRREPRGRAGGAGLSTLWPGQGPGADCPRLLAVESVCRRHRPRSRFRAGARNLLAADPPLVSRLRRAVVPSEAPPQTDPTQLAPPR